MRDSESNDRRVRRTRSQLRSCLCKLLTTKKIQDISVKEIAEMADINRGTFYLHYKDVFDLLRHIEDELMNDFNNILNKYISMPASLDKVAPINKSMLTDIFAYIKDNAAIVSILIGPNGDSRFIASMNDVLRNRIFDHWASTIRSRNIAEFETFYAYTISGCIGMTRQWLDEGLKKTPEHMADLADKFVFKGLSSIMQIN